MLRSKAVQETHLDTHKNPLDSVLPPHTVMERTSLSRTTLWRLVKKGEFPPSVKLSPGRVGWSARAVSDWINAKTGVAA